MSDPLGPYTSTVGIRQIRKDGAAVKSAMVLDFRGSAVAVEYIDATPEQPIASIRVTIASPTQAAFDALSSTVSVLSGNVTAINDAVNMIAPYAVEGGRWTVPSVYEVGGDGEVINALFGHFVMVNMAALGSGDTLTVMLPEVTSADVGRRIAVAEVWGTPDLGSAGPNLHINTAGQPIDFNITLPYSLTGTRPHVVFVACSLGDEVYGWTIESRGNAA